MEIFRKTLATTLLSIPLFFLITPLAIISVDAETANGFSISPPNFEADASPGDFIKNTIKLHNLSAKQITINVKGQNFVAYGDEGQVSLIDEDSTYSINKWLNYSASQFSIEPNANYIFDFTIQIPQNAEPGSHYGAVVFSTSGPAIQVSSGANVVQEVGALILIRIPGPVVEEAKLNSFAPETAYFTNPKVKLNAVVENLGVVHFKMGSVLNIYDILGNKIQTIEADSNNVLPKSKRVFDTEFNFENFGYYKADIQLVYSDGAKVLKSETTFLTLNTPKSIPIALTILAITSLYIIFRKRINKAVRIIVKG